jgi:hypothetical protein
MTTQELVNALFAKSTAGPVRSKVFATFYEDVWRGYLPSLGFTPAPGKPRIYWRDAAPPANLRNLNWSRLAHALELKRSASHCCPDGLLYSDEAAYVWEAKHWIPELFSGSRPFNEHVWDFAWLLARQAVYRVKPFQIAGFVVSWWRDEPGIAETVHEIGEVLAPRTLRVVFTNDMLVDCIEHQYAWYIDLLERKRRDINLFFDALGRRGLPASDA